MTSTRKSTHPPILDQILRKGWIALLVVVMAACWSYSDEGDAAVPAGKKAVVITKPPDLLGLMDSLGRAVDSTYFALPDSVRERLARSAVKEVSWGQLKANRMR